MIPPEACLNRAHRAVGPGHPATHGSLVGT